MKRNHLSIMTLEEHVPNPEFVGRNFNAGEIIQLVLKSQRTGQWLSFRTVQMVMMHELAHCMQMNHSRAFWKVRNQYAEELKGLWGRGYTGDGLWGKGQTLLSGEYDTGRRAEEDVLPEHLCGGAYRSSRRGRKRKRGSAGGDGKTETYAERQQRRIARKFGVDGQALGGDHETRVKLEKGQKVKAKPKVANSARGRELRVQAALARFGQQKEEAKEEGVKKDEGASDGIWESSDDEFLDDVRDEDGSMTQDGPRIHDSQGRDLIKVCGSEDADDVQVKQEMDELRDLEIPRDMVPALPDAAAEETTDEEDKVPAPEPLDTNESGTFVLNPLRHDVNTLSRPPDKPGQEDVERQGFMDGSGESSRAPNSEAMTCPICSMANSPGALLCLACSHVLAVSKVAGSWRCTSATCNGSNYLNAGDCGICGVCGERKVKADDG